MQQPFTPSLPLSSPYAGYDMQPPFSPVASFPPMGFGESTVSLLRNPSPNDVPNVGDHDRALGRRSGISTSRRICRMLEVVGGGTLDMRGKYGGVMRRMARKVRVGRMDARARGMGGRQVEHVRSGVMRRRHRTH